VFVCVHGDRDVVGIVLNVFSPSLRARLVGIGVRQGNCFLQTERGCYHEEDQQQQRHVHHRRHVHLYFFTLFASGEQDGLVMDLGLRFLHVRDLLAQHMQRRWRSRGGNLFYRRSGRRRYRFDGRKLCFVVAGLLAARRRRLRLNGSKRRFTRSRPLGLWRRLCLYKLSAMRATHSSPDEDVGGRVLCATRCTYEAE